MSAGIPPYRERMPGRPFITGAAIRYKNGIVLAGAHHGDAIRIYAALFNSKTSFSGPIRNAEDGFVLSTGRFVSRTEAKQVAIAANQIPSDHVGTLYSEDLWG